MQGFKGIAITGTRGSGKSTLVQALSKQHPEFASVESITTRPRRDDDLPNQYKHVTKKQFENLSRRGLEISTMYCGESYAITRKTLSRIIKDGKVPVLTIAPNLLESASDAFMVVFLDAPDIVLDERLRKRGMELSQEVLTQRRIDRELGKRCRHHLEGLNLEAIIRSTLSLWREQC